MSLTLGTLLGGDAPVAIPPRTLVRHVVALGASGSGKTVFCKALVEEAVMSGIPAICLDPQGDLCSLALAADGPYADAADVVIFTPASTKGVPLCADPLDGSLDHLDAQERLQALTRMAQMVVSLLGFDLDSDDGAGLTAVFDIALTELADAGAPLELAILADHLRDPDADRLARYAQLVDARKLTTARQRLARLDVGARRLLFHDGVPVDVDLLLGRGDRAPAPDGRTRLSIIYLNSLHTQEDKELFVAVIADRLYRWMLDHPSSEPQALFYIDEIAPFAPPVRKPACKETLSLLFKQARKYGVSCVMATQNPGDVDYKAIAQFGTWAIGRLTVRQDLQKIKPALEAIAPDEVDTITAALPARGAGEITLLSPDSFEHAVALSTRRLHSEHRTLDEEAISRLADERFRDRFAPFVRSGNAAEPAPPRPAEPAPPPPPAPAPRRADRGADRGADRVDRGAERVDRGEEDEDPLREPERVLAGRLEMSARELAERMKIGETKARRLLRALVEADRAGVYRKGRTQHYFARASGVRPDLGLGRTVAVAVAAIGEDDAAALARDHIRARLFGLGPDREVFDRAELLYRPLYQIEVEESIPRGLLARAVGADPDRVRGTIYLQPTTLHVLTFHPKDGITFAPRPAERATAVADLDGAVTFDDLPPGSLPIDEPAWNARQDPDRVRAHVSDTFGARVHAVTPFFLPLWQLHLHQRDTGTTRLVTIDALIGRPAAWGAP